MAMRIAWVLWCVLEYAAASSLPHADHPALWGRAGAAYPSGAHFPGDNPARKPEGTGMTLVWSHTLPEYQELALSGEWGKKDFRTGGALSWSSLDSVYRSFTLSGSLGKLILPGWQAGLGYDLETSWTPGLEAWRRQSLYMGHSLNLKDVLTFTGVVYADLHGSWQAYNGICWNPLPAYSLYVERPWSIREDASDWRLVQGIELGTLRLESALAWPGPTLSAGLLFHWEGWQAGTGHIRTPAPLSQTGFIFGYHRNP